jgi:hypothetical protein
MDWKKLGNLSVSFLVLSQNTQDNRLQRKIYFGLWSWRFQFMFCCPVAFGLCQGSTSLWELVVGEIVYLAAYEL